MHSAVFTELINIAVVLMSFVGGYIMYIINAKAKQFDEIVSRLYALEKGQAVINTKLETPQDKTNDSGTI